MFLNGTSGYYHRSGQQYARGDFLVIVQQPVEIGPLRPELRAVVRKVLLEQVGHFMMGDAIIGGFRISLSGAYGADGLPILVDRHYPSRNGIPIRLTEAQQDQLFEALLPIPKELQTQFWEGGGHNSPGSEASALRAWALQNLNQLRKAAS